MASKDKPKPPKGSVATEVFPLPIVFLDLQARELTERKRLLDRIHQLIQLDLENGGDGNGSTLPKELADEIADIKDAVGTPGSTVDIGKADVVDPLFNALQNDLAQTGQTVEDHLLGITMPIPDNVSANEKTLTAVFGILVRDSFTRPELGERFIKAVWNARGEYVAHRALFDSVLPVLINQGQKSSGLFQPLEIARTRNLKVLETALDDIYLGNGHIPTYWSEINAEQWALVVRALVADGVSANDPLLSLKVEQTLAAVAGANDDAPPSSIEIDLPDLEEASEMDIVVDNLHATQAIYFTAMLEELRLFQVVDKLVELFQMGMLPVGKGKAGDLLYRYWKHGATRISEGERRSIYARAFGMPGGNETQGMPNREFNDLFMRFVSAVSSYVRQFKVDSMLRSKIPVVVSQEQVRKSGRDLAANLSLHGYGIAYFVATEMQSQVKEFITLLSDPELKASFGARDMWQVIDQVATLELGGARNSVRFRTMADSGAVIIRWLANHASALASSSTQDILDLNELARPIPRTQGVKATTNPTDSDLVNACERWLAVTGTPDMQVEEYSQPIEAPNQTSRPIQIPSIAKDLLDSVGISAGLSSNGYQNGHHVNGRAYR